MVVWILYERWPTWTIMFGVPWPVSGRKAHDVLHMVRIRMKWRMCPWYNFGARFEFFYPITHSFYENDWSRSEIQIWRQNYTSSTCAISSWSEPYVTCGVIFRPETGYGASNIMVHVGQLSIQNSHHHFWSKSSPNPILLYTNRFVSVREIRWYQYLHHKFSHWWYHCGAGGENLTFCQL